MSKTKVDFSLTSYTCTAFPSYIPQTQYRLHINPNYNLYPKSSSTVFKEGIIFQFFFSYFLNNIFLFFYPLPSSSSRPLVFGLIWCKWWLSSGEDMHGFGIGSRLNGRSFMSFIRELTYTLE